VSSTDKDQNSAPVALPYWQRTKARHVSDLVTGVLSEVVARRAGMTMDLLAAWPDIVGEAYAHYTLPEKILWPKRASEVEAFQPGVLVVACDSAKAIFFQHETAQLLERLNYFFGFQAVHKIKLVQRPIGKMAEKPAPKPKLNDSDRQRLSGVLEQIEDPALKERLKKFGEGVIKRQKTSSR